VRTRFADVNIFAPSSQALAGAGAAEAMQTETLMNAMGDLLTRIAAPADFTLTSNPTAFNNTMLAWLTDPHFHLPNGSIVGLCCSSLLGLQFQEEGSTPGGSGSSSSSSNSTDGLLPDFRLFLLATSLAHAGWRDNTGASTLKTRDLCAAGQISGYRLLKRLDRILTPQFLSRCGRESCQVLFLLVLGAVLGVGYSASQLGDDQSPAFPAAEQTMLSPEFQRSPTLWLAMKEHLCQMLAHHLIFVGSMLGIRLETGLEQRIIDTAVKRWNKAEEFVWADVVGYPVQTPPGRAESSATVKNEDGDGDSVSGERSLGLAPPPPPRLVPIPCPDVRQFQPQTTDAWSENPTSYLSMFEESDTFGVESVGRESMTQEVPAPSNRGAESEVPPQHEGTKPLFVAKRAGETDPYASDIPEPSLPRRRPGGKRRSIWIVRPFDAGPEQGLVNVYARLRGGTDMDTLRAFV
jgi:hypothetical protein